VIINIEREEVYPRAFPPEKFLSSVPCSLKFAFSFVLGISTAGRKVTG
jgi:hypothetical protein